MESPLSKWLNDELKNRGWSQREAARRAGISHAAIANILQDVGEPLVSTYEALARAFEMPLPEILQIAGVLPLPPAPVRDEDRLLSLWRQLDPRQRRDVLDMLAALADDRPNPRRQRPGTTGAESAQAHPACLAVVLGLLEKKEIVTKEDIWWAIHQIDDPEIAEELADILETIWQKRKEERNEEERAHCM